MSQNTSHDAMRCDITSHLRLQQQLWTERTHSESESICIKFVELRKIRREILWTISLRENEKKIEKLWETERKNEESKKRRK